MAKIRSGRDYVAALKRRRTANVWIAGRKVDDVTSDPFFQRPIEAIAALYDLQTNSSHGVRMAGDEGYGLSFLIPATRDDLVARRRAMEVWAHATFGMVGRSPDYCNTVLMRSRRPDFSTSSVPTSAGISLDTTSIAARTTCSSRTRS